MFGRTDLIAQVADQFEHVARSREPAVVTLTGEPGLGKTRFLIEFEALLATRYPDVQVAYGRALASHSSSATFQPLREAISDLLTSSGGANEAEGRGRKILRTLRTTAPDWLAALPAVGDALAAAAKTAENWRSAAPSRLDDSMTRQFCRLIEEICTSAPLVLLLDDLHWVDTSTVDLIYSLTQTVTEVPLMLVCAYREADLRATATGEPHPMLETLLRIERYRGLTSLSLASLDETEIDQLVHSQLGVRPRPSLTDRLVQLTGGNPLFVQEYVGLLLDHGVGLLPEEYEDLLERFADNIPRRIEAVVEERLLRLTSVERRCLEVAACIGPVFSPELLINAVELDQASTREALRSLCRKHALIHAAGSAGRFYAFHHVTVANVLRHDYLEKDPFDYQSTHAQIARYLIERAHDDLGVKEAIAHHTAESGDRAWAIARGLDAANAAWTLGAVTEAHKLLKRVVQPLDREVMHVDELPAALTRYAQAANASGAHDDVVLLGDQLQEIAMQTLSSNARLALEIAFAYRMRNLWAQARLLADQVLARPDVTANEHASALLLLGQIELCGAPPDPERAIEVFTSGVDIATAPSVLYRLEGHLGLSRLALGQTEEAYALLAKAVETATRTHHPWDRYEAIHWLSKAQIACLQLDEASASLVELEMIVDASGVASTIPFHLRDEARVEALRGVLPMAASLYLDYVSAASAVATETAVQRALATVACQVVELNTMWHHRGDQLVEQLRLGLAGHPQLPAAQLAATLSVAWGKRTVDELRSAISAGKWPIEMFHFDAAEAIFRFDVLDLPGLRSDLQR
jgi:tetratricopeptide (TPR) repeat protein